jgi:hypothetical protein
MMRTVVLWLVVMVLLLCAPFAFLVVTAITLAIRCTERPRCALWHRAYWRVGLCVARCLRCGRTWIAPIVALPGGGERSALRDEEPALRVMR